MRLKTRILAYYRSFSPRAVLLMAIGLIPLSIALAFLLCVKYIPAGVHGYDTVWLRQYYSFWVDSFGLSYLILIGGVVLLDYAERYDSSRA